MLEPAPPRPAERPTTPNQQKISVYMHLDVQVKVRQLSSHLGKNVSTILRELVEQEYADHARLNGWTATP